MNKDKKQKNILEANKMAKKSTSQNKKMQKKSRKDVGVDLNQKIDANEQNAGDKKLNIGLFVDAFFPMIDGVVSVVDNYAKRLCKIANTTVFTTAPRDKNFVDNYPYKVVRCSKFEVPGLDYDLGLPNLDAKFQRELKNSKLDIVHIHSPFSVGKAGLAYAKRHRLPVVATNHSQFKQDFFKATKSPAITDILLDSIMKVFNACDENWSVNKEVAKVYDEYGLKKPAKVVNNATDMMFLQNFDGEDLKAKYNIKDGDKVLLFVGRICEIKNIFFILESLIELKKLGFEYKMIFVGTGQDEVILKKKIEKNKMQDCVFLAGKISDRGELARYYRLANLFLFPSMYDCSSLVQIESASQKTPTLFLKGSVTSDGIVDNFNGYYADAEPKLFAKRIVEIFADERYDEICENCYKTVYVNWDEKIADVYQNYLRLIKQKRIKNNAIDRKNTYKKTIKIINQQKLMLKQQNQKLKAKQKKSASKTTKKIENKTKNNEKKQRKLKI